MEGHIGPSGGHREQSKARSFDSVWGGRTPLRTTQGVGSRHRIEGRAKRQSRFARDWIVEQVRRKRQKTDVKRKKAKRMDPLLFAK